MHSRKRSKRSLAISRSLKSSKVTWNSRDITSRRISSKSSGSTFFPSASKWSTMTLRNQAAFSWVSSPANSICTAKVKAVQLSKIKLTPSIKFNLLGWTGLEALLVEVVIDSIPVKLDMLTPGHFLIWAKTNFHLYGNPANRTESYYRHSRTPAIMGGGFIVIIKL